MEVTFRVYSWPHQPVLALTVMNSSAAFPISSEQFQVQGMTCQHCVRAVTQAIQASDAQAQVEVDLAAGRVTVRSALPRDRITAVIREEGYSVAA